jgi:hypothetical protein
LIDNPRTNPQSNIYPEKLDDVRYKNCWPRAMWVYSIGTPISSPSGCWGEILIREIHMFEGNILPTELFGSTLAPAQYPV